MQPESKKLLSDMHTGVTSIRQFIVGKSFTDFQNDDLLRSAIYFQFLIIGEALTQLRQLDSQVAQQISESGRIVGFRNQVIHGYAKIDDQITWRIIQDKLPILQRELDELLAE